LKVSSRQLLASLDQEMEEGELAAHRIEVDLGTDPMTGRRPADDDPVRLDGM
jgi:hypothetical protein